MRDITVDKVSEFQQTFLQRLRAEHQQDVLDVLSSGKITEEATKIIEHVAADTAATYKA